MKRAGWIITLLAMASLSAFTVPAITSSLPPSDALCVEVPELEVWVCGTTTTTTAPTTTTTTTAPTTTAATTTTTAPTTTTSTTTTTAPTGCQGVQVAAGANLVTVANAHGPGTTFCLAAGTYSLGAAIPVQSGDRFIGALGSAGQRLSILTGGGSTSRAFTCTCSGGEIANVVIDRFATPQQTGPAGPAFTNWTWRNIESRLNASDGIHVHDGSRVIDSYLHHNGEIGIGGQGDNALVEGNEIAFNNQAGATSRGGGSKWVNTVNLTVRDNYVHDNLGPGLWTDGSNVGTVYEGNMVEDNTGAGIFHELGGTALITGNTVSCNKGAGEIYIANSRGTASAPIVVSDNIVGEHCNANVASLAAKDDPNRSPRLGYVRFENNQVTAENRLAGIFGITPWVAPGIEFVSNDYFSDLYGSGGTGWRVSDALLTWEQWRARGFDLAGTRQAAP